MSLASCMWLALPFASCSTSDAEEDMEEVVDTPTDDEGQDNGTSDEETALKDVSITVYDASNICGFGTDIDIFLDGNMEKVSATGVALSVSAENLEKEPKEWIHGIVDAPQPTPGLQTLRIKGLRGETTYYCRPFVRSSDDEYLWGEIKEFTTTEEVLFGQRTRCGQYLRERSRMSGEPEPVFRPDKRVQECEGKSAGCGAGGLSVQYPIL